MIAIEHPKQKTEVQIIFGKIESGLIAFEERKAELTELKNESAGLKITSIDDTQNITLVSSARRKLKAARVAVEKEGKMMRDPLTQISKNISAKEKELIAIIEPTELELIAQEKWVDSEKEKIEQDKENAKKAMIQARINRLSQYGFSIELETISTIDDATFEIVVNNAKAEHEKELAEKDEAERLRQAEIEKIKKDREELELLRQQQAEAQKIIDAEYVRIRKEQAEKGAAIKAAQQKIEDEKKAIIHAEELDHAKKEAAEQARVKTIADAAREAEEKANSERLAKLEKERQAALRPDKEKLQAFADALTELKLPEVSDEDMQVFVGNVELMIYDIKEYILNKIQAL